MAYTFVTYSKQGDCFHLVFENDLEPVKYLKVKFLPTLENYVPDLSLIRMRDPEALLYYLEQYGLTLITEGLE